MTRLRRPWPTLVGVGLLIVGMWAGFRHFVPTADQHDKSVVPSPGSDQATSGKRRLPDGLAVPQSPGIGGTGSAISEPAVDIAARVEPLMKDWRQAIINKDPDTVLSLDSAFATYPREFTPALMASAQGDPEERVRSFSTRVLGKLRSPESVELMRKLLADKSEYVRFNAAWALGELGDQTAVTRLRQLQHRDPSSSVRQSALESLRKLEGG